MPWFSVGELAERVSGTVEGDPSREVSGVAPVDRAGPADLTFVTNARYGRSLEANAPGAVLAPPDLALPTRRTACIRVPDPQLALTRLLPLFFPDQSPPPGVAATASIGRGVHLGERTRVGPYALIGDGAWIGDGTVVGPLTVVEGDVRIGRDCDIAHSCSLLRGARLGDRVRLHPGVRVGTEGFGYVPGPEGPVKFPQVGGCIIGDDVEIGANTTIDRGALGDTVVGSGTKIDNLVHVGHNVEIGRNCTIVAQVGIAGSVTVGDGAVLAGQAGIADHLSIGAGARVGAQAGVIGNVPAGAEYSGYPARPHREAMRASAALFRLPDLLRRLRAVERRLDMDDDAE